MVVVVAVGGKMTLFGDSRWTGGEEAWPGRQPCGSERADKEPTNCSQSERAWQTLCRSAWNRYKRVNDHRPRSGFELYSPAVDAESGRQIPRRRWSIGLVTLAGYGRINPRR